MFGQGSSSGMDCQSCDRCITSYLKGLESCADCKRELHADNFRGAQRVAMVRKATALQQALARTDEDEFGFDAADDAGDESPPSPIEFSENAIIHIVGVVTCLVIVLSMFSV